MGILDDAIREHLDLKRQRGATESELKQLEDEAFGPPSRPGEPDFPEAEVASEQSGNGLAVDAPVSDSSLEPPVAEHPVLEEAAEAQETHGDEEGSPAASEESAPHTSEATPESEELTAIYDPTTEREAESEELEPELHEDRPDAEASEQPPEDLEEGSTASVDEHEEGGDPGGDPPADAPIESLDTVEHPPPDQVSEGEGDDDVLADTPEFLKDAPEDDELWFEQGEPKDFDF
jgi:hypothetical protein